MRCVCSRWALYDENPAKIKNVFLNNTPLRYAPLFVGSRTLCFFGCSPDLRQFFKESNSTHILRSRKALRGTPKNSRRNHSQMLTGSGRSGGSGVFYTTNVMSRRNGVNFMLDKKCDFKEFESCSFLDTLCIMVKLVFQLDRRINVSGSNR